MPRVPLARRAGHGPYGARHGGGMAPSPGIRMALRIVGLAPGARKERCENAPRGLMGSFKEAVGGWHVSRGPGSRTGEKAFLRGGYRSHPFAAFPAFPGKAAGTAEKTPAQAMAGHGQPERNGEGSSVHGYSIPWPTRPIKWTLGVFVRNYEGNAPYPGPVRARRGTRAPPGRQKERRPAGRGRLAGRCGVRRCPGLRRGLPSRCRTCRAGACPMG